MKDREFRHLERFDRGNAAIRLSLVVIAGEGTLQISTGVSQVDGFLHSNVTPVRDLNGASDTADGEEGCVVLIVDLHYVLHRAQQQVRLR